MTSIKLHHLQPTDEALIAQIADWYVKGWAIPKERTTNRLINHPNDDALFQ